MRRLLLLLLVVLVIAAVADARRKSRKRHSKKILQGFIPALTGKLKNLFGTGGKKHHTHKGGHHHTHQGGHHHHTHHGGHHHHTHHGGHHHHHTHSHTHTSSSHTQISYKYKYKINIKHNYQHEVHCGKHCVPDIAFWKKDHCACKVGLVGAGDLCCTDPHEYKYTCTVRGDPYVHSYMKQSAQIFNPCGQVLAVINAKTSTHESCHVTIRSADVIEEGIFITNQVETTVDIGGKVSTIILNGYGFYNSVENKWEDLGNVFSKCFDVHGEKIQLLLDNERKVWTLSACGTLVNFRRDTKGGKPGVCISSKYEFSKKPCDHPTDIVCNRLEEDTYPYDRKATYYLAKSFELNEYLKLKLTCAYHNLCKDVTHTFKKCCPARKAKAINACSAILEHDFRSCATLHGGTHGASLFKKFVQCMKAYCEGDQEWCYTEMASELFISCKARNIHCCDFKKGGSGGGGGGGGQQQLTQQKL